MKTHLPHGLRAALIAALASVSISTAYADAPLIEGQYAVDWDNVTLTDKGKITGNTVLGVFCPTVLDQASHYDGNTNPFEHINVVRTESNYKTGDIYFDVINAQQTNSRSIVGVDQSVTTTANIYARIGNAQSNHMINVVVGVDSNVSLDGNVYMELADSKATYTQSVSGSRSSNITGSSTIVIRDGTFQDKVAAGFSAAATAGSTIGGGSYLQIEGGTFQQEVVAGSIQASGTATITGGTHLLINGGTFNGNVIAGNTGDGTSTITGGTHLLINGGTFNGDVYGGSRNATGSITGGVDMMITGGTLRGKIYGAGTDNNCPVEGDVNITITGTTTFEAGYLEIYARGAGVEKVTGDINLTISGDNIKFGNAANTIIYLGADNGTSRDVAGKDTLTLAHLTEKSELAAETLENRGFRFIGTKDSTLVLSDVKASIKKDMNDFYNMAVKDGSRVTLDTEGNKTLGGATTVTVEKDSTLTSEGISVSGRDEKGATITKGSSATLATATKIQDAKVELADTASINTQLENVDLVNAKAGTKMTVNNISGTQNTATVSSKATVNLVNISTGKDGILKELNISGEGTFGVYKNGNAVPGADDSNVGALTLAEGSKITIGQGGGTLEANLTTERGSTLDFSAGATLTMGCELHVGDDTCIVLSGENYDSLLSGGTVTLFTGVDNVINAEMAASDLIICRVTADGTKLEDQVSFYTDENNNAVLTLTANVPEPTTGTLSLLALAGLAARRRRKH